MRRRIAAWLRRVADELHSDAPKDKAPPPELVHRCSPNIWDRDHGGYLCLCGRVPAHDWYAAWKKENP